MRLSRKKRLWNSNVVRITVLLGVIPLLLSGCGGGSNMIQATRLTSPASGKALVTFIRPSVFGGAISFGIWDSGDFVGILGAGTCIQYEATPGEHYLMARAENWSCVKADLAANRHYVIKANPVMGVWKARVAFDPITKADYAGGQLAPVKKWLASANPIKVDPEKVEAYAEPRRAEVLQARGMFESGSGRSEALAAEDYLPE